MSQFLVNMCAFTVCSVELEHPMSRCIEIAVFSVSKRLNLSKFSIMANLLYGRDGIPITGIPINKIVTS